jgi:hypothetical protein
MQNQASSVWLSPPALAERLAVPVSTLRYWRQHHIGPPATMIGGRLRYWLPSVEAWESEARALTAA